MDATKNRLVYIDNLRLLMIILVVMIHLSCTYSGLGDWYYVEPTEIGILEMIVFGCFQSFTQGYFMGILFLIAGYFIPSSYDKKGFGKFIKDRLIRLGIPSLIYMLIISPFINIVLLNHRNFGNDGFLLYYIKRIITFDFIGSSGPLWFAFALLIFSIVYALIRKVFNLKAKNSDKEFPSTSKIVMLILLISVFAFLIRIFQPIGTNIANMQLCFFSQYIILFIVGIRCKRNNWFEKIEYSQGKVWLFLGIIPSLIFWVVIMISGGALNGNLDVFYGGVSWQSAAYALWESFTCVAISIGLISLFKEKYNKQNKLIKIMSDNAFSVYVFHAPIIIALSLFLQSIKINLILKFVMVVIISIPLCFLFSNFIIRKIPVLKKLL